MFTPTKPAKIDSLTKVSNISDVIELLQKFKHEYGYLPVFTTYESPIKLDSVELISITDCENGLYIRKAIIF